MKYWRLNANTCIVAAILFSAHPYIGDHYRDRLIAIHLHSILFTAVHVLKTVLLQFYKQHLDTCTIDTQHYSSTCSSLQLDQCPGTLPSIDPLKPQQQTEDQHRGDRLLHRPVVNNTEGPSYNM